MGKASRDKGARYENELVRILQKHGIAAERVPLSGAAGGSFGGDVNVPYLRRDHRYECKIRRMGFRELYKWLAGNVGLFIRADRAQTLVVVRLTDFCELLNAAEDGRVKRECVAPPNSGPHNAS